MVIEYVIYTVITLCLGSLASILGSNLGAVDLETAEGGAGTTLLWGPLMVGKYKSAVRLFSSDLFTVRPVPTFIFTALAEIIVLVLVARGILNLSLVSIILTIVGLVLGVTIISVTLSSFISKLILNYDPKYIDYKQDSERKRRRKQMRGTPTVKVYKCGICGESETSGQYVVSSSSRAPAIVLCRKHSRYSPDLLADAFECPHCGYRFDPENNPAYFQEHQCDNCKKELEYIKP